MRVDGYNGAVGYTDVDVDLPGNSNRKKGDTGERPKVEKVISSSAIRREKTLGAKIREIFTGDETRGLVGYILTDIVIPTTKVMIEDMIKGGIEMILYGEARAGSRGGSRRTSYTSYSSYHKNDSRNRASTEKRRARLHDFSDVVIPTRSEAQEIMDQLADIVIDYEYASVEDFYSLAGLRPSPTDAYWGWYDTSGWRVRQVRDGYVVDLPKPVELG